jgi:sugar/nucleoside kinase (ribokinase family)
MNAAKLDDCAAGVARVSADEKGDYILDVFPRLRIDCSMVQRSDRVPTSETILPIQPNGERPLRRRRGASDRLVVDVEDSYVACGARFPRQGGTGSPAAVDHGANAKLLRLPEMKGRATAFDRTAANGKTLSLSAELSRSAD